MAYIGLSGFALLRCTSVTDIRFDDKACHLLSERIRSNRESLALEILLLTINADGGEGLSVQGVASVNLWVMVEDSVSILRQVIDQACKWVERL